MYRYLSSELEVTSWYDRRHHLVGGEYGQSHISECRGSTARSHTR